MKKTAAIFAGGAIFGVGLVLSGMTEQEVVLSFLHLEDFGLAVVMAAAVAVTLPIYQLTPRRIRVPLLGGAFEERSGRVAPNHVLGGVVFGLGWGVSGVCPGAALASLATGNWPMLAGAGGMLVGAYLQGWVADVRSPAVA